MVLALSGILVALFIGFGAVQEFIVRGLRAGETQPFFVSLAGIFVSILVALSGLAFWRQWPNARRIAIIAAVSSILFHAYASLPPHRNVGPPALIVGIGYGLVLLGVVMSSRGRKVSAA